MPRNDTRVIPAVAFQLEVPTANVTLTSAGLFGFAFDTNIQYLVQRTNLDDLLYPYRLRHNASYDGPGTIWGWDNFVPGSTASAFLMGAAGTLKWRETAQLRTSVDYLISGIAENVEPDGFALGFLEEDTNSDYNGDNQNPSYVQSWFLHGALEAYGSGNTQALEVARKHCDWWNNCTYLPQLYPQDSGPDHWGPEPNGYNPAGGTMSTGPFAHGHMLYWMNQAGIGHSRMAMSDMGTQADVDFLVKLFQEDWWLAQLAARDTDAIWARQWYPDNYEVTTLECYADLYVLTGNTTYLDAVLGAWAMWRDPNKGWIFPGGSFSINENYVYPPGSLPLEFTGNDGWSTSTRPTGEMCPSAFWTKLNQRFHRLMPDNETFTWEMERSLYNVALAAQAPNGAGVRYFAVMHKNKQGPTWQATCCESQNTRLFGSIPEYVFSLLPNGGGVYLDLYEAGSISTKAANGATVTVTVQTMWPYDSGVNVSVTTTSDLPAGSFDLALRMPQWLAGSVPVTINGQPYAGGQGAPGTYLHITGVTYAAATPTILSYSIPMAWETHAYNGSTQIGSYSRYAYTYGPFLMAAEGPWDNATNCIIMNAAGGLDPQTPGAWLTPVPPSSPEAGSFYPPLPSGAASTLRFTVNGLPGYTFVPYFGIQSETELFATYPIIVGPSEPAELARA